MHAANVKALKGLLDAKTFVAARVVALSDMATTGHFSSQVKVRFSWNLCKVKDHDFYQGMLSSIARQFLSILIQHSAPTREARVVQTSKPRLQD